MKQVYCKRCGAQFVTVKEVLCDECRRKMREQKAGENVPNHPKPKEERKLW